MSDIDRQMQQDGFWSNPTQNASIMQQRRQLERRLQTLNRLRSDADELATWRELLEEGESDGDLDKFLDRLEEDLNTLELELKLSGPDDDKNAILAIHPGAGGTESQDWAEMLLRMYLRWAEQHDFEVELLERQEGEEAGIKSATFAVRGPNAYGYLNSEAGVHRLVRISPFDFQARRHTSFASVDVYPEVDDNVDIEVNDKDLRVDTYRSSGAGGQHVNKTDSAVRITHLPSGIVVTSSEKSQHQNRARAMKALKVKLYDQQREALDTARSDARKSQVGSGDRSERIRTYNFPQARVTDHRINLTLYNLPKIMEGEALDDVINPLIAEDQAARLSALEDEFN
jgi:peptide chain release factor 1